MWGRGENVNCPKGVMCQLMRGAKGRYTDVIDVK
jgi:hypothetical protein